MSHLTPPSPLPSAPAPPLPTTLCTRGGNQSPKLVLASTLSLQFSTPPPPPPPHSLSPPWPIPTALLSHSSLPSMLTLLSRHPSLPLSPVPALTLSVTGYTTRICRLIPIYDLLFSPSSLSSPASTSLGSTLSSDSPSSASQYKPLLVKHTDCH
ncbi:proline-rich receptor-like protein kinase PERK2 [Cannabis sativa]|uniref:proline-rich receptor-like protein kinase PERK2 n=1 Tax=Cannabis sativa TaxID=3483 RepID=UPI0029CA07D3|nr:proline-rich receptor-like protein kinase PERK2 [Cannabis sativa]